MQYHLYTGQACHLCDIAIEVIQRGAPQILPMLEKVDIKSDPQLYHLYAVRIPVLKRLDTEQALFWPFDEVLLQEFVA